MSFYRDHKAPIVIICGALALTVWSNHLGIGLEGIGDFIIAWFAFCLPVMLFYAWATSKD